MKLHCDLAITQKRTWMLAHKIRTAYEQGQQSHGTVGNATVVGVKERGSNQVHAQVIGDAKRVTLHRLVTEWVEAGSIVCTDDLVSYRGFGGV